MFSDRRAWVVCVTLLTCCVIVTGTVSAQIVNATLSGSVTDTTGAAIPDAIVTINNVENGIGVKTSSNSAGEYFFPHVSPGNYTITADKSGFRSTIVSGVTLLVNQQARVDVQLQVGSVATHVEVNGAAPLVETTTATVGTVIGQGQTVDLPLNLRRFGALATLVPGTVSDNGGQASSYYYTTFSEQPYAASGGRDASNLVLIDGVDSRNWGAGGFSLQPPPDAVQEFKLQTNIYSAAFGIAAGSTINLVTKSGTNELHGSVYEFLRNEALDARNFFATNQTNPLTGAEIPGSARPKYIRNQFGFTLGGPIRKNKTFWFGNYEGLRQIQGLSLGSFVPDAAERSGDFSSFLTGKTANLCGSGGQASLNFDTGQLFYPGTLSNQTCPSGAIILVGTPIPGNKIANLDPVAQKVLPYIPLPNRPGFPNFVNQEPSNRRDNLFDVRIDHLIGPKDQLFGRYLFGQSNILNPGNLPGFGTTVYNRAQNFALGWTHTFGPHLLNDARFGFQREYDLVNCEKCDRPAGTLASFGIQNLVGSPLLEAIPYFGFANFQGVGDSLYSPDIVPDMVEKYSDNLTWTHGRHTVVVGADIQQMQSLRWTSVTALQGNINYSGQFSSLAGAIPGVSGVADFADFLLGYPSYGRRNFADHFLNVNARGNGMFNFYGQDDYRISPNLTLNLGLRWEYRRAFTDTRDNTSSLIAVGAPFSGPGNALLVTPAPDALNDSYCTNPAYSYLISASGECLVASSAERAKLGFTGRTRRTLIYPYYRDFAPRIGLTWRPNGSDKFVIHTGYGIFYDLPLFNQWADGGGNAVNSPIGLFTTAVGSPPPLTNGAPTTTESVFGVPGIPPVSEQAPSFHPNPDFQPPRFQEWSFGVQSQLAQNWALEVNYIGNNADHLGLLHLFGNRPRPGLGPFGPRRPYPDFGDYINITSNANSNYNSLQAKLTKRFAHGLTFLTSYTWAHNLSDNEGDEGFTGGVGNLSPQDDNNPRADYGNTYVDARQRFVFSSVWALPIGNGQHFLNRGGALNAILGGWRVSDIITLQSGFPITVLSNQDYSNTGTLSLRPDRLCNGSGQKTVSAWFNAACFSTAALQQALAAGTPRFGNAGRNILEGPGLSNLDIALLKDFGLTERFKLEFRAEFYNTFNQAHFGPPSTLIGNSNVGQISSAGAPRDVQFGLKVVF